jgi:hypothetical protein
MHVREQAYLQVQFWNTSQAKCTLTGKGLKARSFTVILDSDNFTRERDLCHTYNLGFK